MIWSIQQEDNSPLHRKQTEMFWVTEQQSHQGNESQSRTTVEWLTQSI